MKQRAGLWFVILLMLVPAGLRAQDLTLDQKIELLQKRLANQQIARDGLRDLHGEMTRVQGRITKLESRSTKIMQDNVIKATLKGGYDLIQKLGATTTAPIFLLQTSIDLYNALDAEPDMLEHINSPYHYQKGKLDDLKQSLTRVMARNQDIREELEALRRILAADLPMFDNDSPYFKHNLITAPFWPEGDNETDDDAERTMRKLKMIQLISSDTAKSLAEEAQQIRNDWRTMDGLMEETRKEIARIDKMRDKWDYTPAAQPVPPPAEKPLPPPPSAISGRCFIPAQGRWQSIDSYRRTIEQAEKYWPFVKQTRLTMPDIPATVLVNKQVSVRFLIQNPLIPSGMFHYVWQVRLMANGKQVGQYYRNSGPLGVDGTTYSERAWLTFREPGTQALRAEFALLNSCNKKEVPIAVGTAKIRVASNLNLDGTTVTFRDPPSVVKKGVMCRLIPMVENSAYKNPMQEMNLKSRLYVNDKLLYKCKGVTLYDLSYRKLPEEINEVRIEIYDSFTGEFIDAYLHRITNPIPEGTRPKPAAVASPAAGTPGHLKAPTYDPDLEGKRETIMNMGWSAYDYVFSKGEIRIDGYYFWGNQKVPYTSEPVYNYQKGVQQVPGMMLTSQAGYHIYPTKPMPGDGPCARYNITQMKGADIIVLHRLKACDFTVSQPPGGPITVIYRGEGAARQEKLILP